MDFKEQVRELRNQISKDAEWYCGIEGVWISEIRGYENIRYKDRYFDIEDTEKWMYEIYYDSHPDVEDEIDDDDFYKYFQDNPNLLYDLLDGIIEESINYPPHMRYGVVGGEYNNGQVNLYITTSEENAKMLYEIFCDIEENCEDADYDYNYVESLMVDIIENIRYGGEDEIDDCIIFNTTHTPYMR